MASQPSHPATITPPPGLEGFEIECITHDYSPPGQEWDSYEEDRPYTNSYLFNKDRTKILLGLKKRGFGQGLYNGFGGKPEAGETILETAKRELKEEAGIDAPLEFCGVLFFKSISLDFAHRIYIFKASEFTGTVTESDEMRPEWFSLNGSGPDIPVPYDTMWAQDRLWFPFLVDEIPFVGRVDFAESPTGDKSELDALTRYWFGKVKQLSVPANLAKK